jgi:hypothetical protein
MKGLLENNNMKVSLSRVPQPSLGEKELEGLGSLDD